MIPIFISSFSSGKKSYPVSIRRRRARQISRVEFFSDKRFSTNELQFSTEGKIHILNTQNSQIKKNRYEGAPRKEIQLNANKGEKAIKGLKGKD